MVEGKKNIKIQIVALAIGLMLLLIKMIAYLLTNSNAILTDALESIINIVAGSFALYSLILAAKPKDKEHPYGHGKIEFISAGLEGGMIAIAGLLIIGKPVYNFFVPIEVKHLDIGIVIVGFAGLVNFITGHVLEKTGKKTHSFTLIADGKHLKTDAYSSIGLIVGLFVIYFTNIIWLDNVVAIGFGIFICYMGFRILRKSVAGIMDETDFKIVAEITEILNIKRRGNWIDIHNFRLIKFGSTLHIDCHITLPWYINNTESHYEIKTIEDLANEHFGRSVEFFIHVDPCIDSSCGICQKTDCEVRKQEMKKKVKWNIETVMFNKKHSIARK